MKRHTAAIGIVFCVLALAASGAAAREYHVSVTGDDANDGGPGQPLATISAAAKLCRPGDVVTIHAGTYRERITPPRGGTSDEQRITYQAAPGEEVVIKGSEVVTGWEKVQHDTWKVTLPNDFFGDFNPYSDLIHGDWFNPKGREHHTGAVYLDGHWLTEAAKLDDVLQPAGDAPLWFGRVDEKSTTIWAQFKGVDPNQGQVEINVRRAVTCATRPASASRWASTATGGTIPRKTRPRATSRPSSGHWKTAGRRKTSATTWCETITSPTASRRASSAA